MPQQWNYSGLEMEKKPRPQAAAAAELGVQPAGDHWDFSGLEMEAKPQPRRRATPPAAEPAPVEPVRADTAPGFLSGLAEMVTSPVETARDVAVATAKGVIGLGEATVGLADIATLGRAGKLLEETTGFDPQLTSQFLSGYYSESMQRQQRNLEQAEGFVDTAVAALSNPRTIGAAVAESLPIMGGGAAIARKLVLGGMGYAAAGAIGEGIASGGATAETIRQQAEGRVLSPTQAALSVASGAATSVFGMFGARLAKKLGIVDVETMLAGGLSNTPARRNLVAAVVLGAVQEGFLEELPQSVQEQIAQNMALDRPWHEGVSEAAVMGSLAGVVMGGGAQGAAAAGAALSPSEAPAAPPAAPPVVEPAAEAEIRPVAPPPAPQQAEPPPVQPLAPPPPEVAPRAAELVTEGPYAGEEMGPEARRMLGIGQVPASFGRPKLKPSPAEDTAAPRPRDVPEILAPVEPSKEVAETRAKQQAARDRAAQIRHAAGRGGRPEAPPAARVPRETPAVVAGVQVVETPAPPDAEEHDYSSTQVNLPDTVTEEIQAVGATIAPNDLTEDGLEEESHVTVRFGLHSRPETLERVTKLLAGTGPITVTLGKTSVFTTAETGKDYEVVKVDVDSPDLKRLNKLLGGLPNTETHAYTPHVTIAYVKPGTGEKYAGRDDLEGTTIQLGSINFTRKDESAVEIPLTGPAAEGVEPAAAVSKPKPAPAVEPVRRLTKPKSRVTKAELQRRHEAVRAEAKTRQAITAVTAVSSDVVLRGAQDMHAGRVRLEFDKAGAKPTEIQIGDLLKSLGITKRAESIRFMRGNLRSDDLWSVYVTFQGFDQASVDKVIASVGGQFHPGPPALEKRKKLLPSIEHADTTSAERANVGRMLTAIESSEFVGKQFREVEGQGSTKEVTAGAAAHPIFAQLVGRTGTRGVPTFGWSRAKVEADLTTFLEQGKRSTVSDAAVELARRLPISHAAVAVPEHALAPEPGVAPRERVTPTEVEEELQALPLDELRAQVESMRAGRAELDPEGQALVDDAERILSERTAAEREEDVPLPGPAGLAEELSTATEAPVADAPFALAAQPAVTEREAVAREEEVGLFEAPKEEPPDVFEQKILDAVSAEGIAHSALIDAVSTDLVEEQVSKVTKADRQGYRSAAGRSVRRLVVTGALNQEGKLSLEHDPTITLPGAPAEREQLGGPKPLLVEGQTAWTRTKTQIDELAAISIRIDNGEKGLDRPGRVTSLAGRIRRLIGSGDSVTAQRALDYVTKRQRNLQTPIFTPRNKIWTAIAAAKAKGSAPSGAATVGAFAEPAAVPTGLDQRLQFEHTSQTRTPEGLKIQGIEFPELVELAEELIGTPNVVRAFRGKPKLGLFRAGEGPGSAAITLHADLFKVGQEHQLAATIAHEIGHAVDWLPTNTLKRGNILGRLQSLQRFLKHTFSSRTGDLVARKDVTDELKALSMKWRPWDRPQAEPNFIKYRDSSRELYADAISALLNDPDLLERDAPIFYREFFSQLDNKPEVHKAYFDLQELLSGTREELVARRTAGDRRMLESGDVAAMDVQRRKQQEREAGQRDLWLRLRTQLVDRNTKVIDLVKSAKKAGRTINPDDDPRYMLEERNYIGGLLQGTVKRHFAPVHEALNTAGIDWHTFGRALFYDRIVAGDRSEIANPKGRTPVAAQELRAHLDTALGPEKTAVLNEQTERFRAAVRGVAEQAYQAGLYTDELHEQMQKNPAYVTFQVIEHLEEGVSSRVYKQIGTLKEITNPADASILKTLVTLKAIEHQRVKSTTVEFLEQNFADEVKPAKTVWSGKGHRPVESKDPKEKLITYFRKGRPVGVYVDPYISDALTGARIGDTFAAVTILRKINSRFYRPIFTTFNLGFQSFNISRDAWRFWTNQPDMTVARMVRRYWQAVPMAKLRVWGLKAKPTEAQLKAWEDLLQAEEGKILSITFNDFMTGRRVEDTRIEQILAEHGVGGFHETPRHPALRPVMAVLDQIANLGDFIETLPKAAAMYEYKGAGEIADIPPDVRSFIRRKVGSPDFLAGGTWKPTTNEVFLFSNAITQAIRSDVEVATDPQTRSGFWFKLALSAFLPKMLMMGAMLGLGGEALRRMMQKASEYDRTNYIIIPLGEDDTGNVHYWRVPMSDAGRFVGGLLWKAMRLAKGDQEVIETLGQVFDYGAGQIPSVTPTIDLVSTTAQYLSGRNPYDAFRGRYVFTRDEFAAKDWGTLKKFLGWQFQQHGGGIVWKFYPGEARPRQRTPAQKTIELPIVSNIAGRFYRITNYGELEGLRDVQGKVQRDEARGRLLQREKVNNAIRTIMEQPRARRSDRFQEDLASGIARELGYNPLQDEAAWKAKVRQVDKAIKMGVIRGRADPVTDAVMSATSNSQKVAIILRARSSMPAAEFRVWMGNAVKNGVVSKNVNAVVKERMRGAR